MKKYTIAMSVIVVLMVFTYLIYNFDEIINFPSITGNALVDSRLVIITEVNFSCNMTFEAGWNLVSFPCLSANEDLVSFLDSFNSSYQSIRTYQANAIDPWKTYNPNLPSWVVHDLTEISRREGYWIQVDNQSVFFANSTLATPTLIDLVAGFNLIGYPSSTIRQVNDTFGSLIPDFDYVYFYNASDQSDPWKQWTWNSSLPSDQDLNKTAFNYGFWILVHNTSTITIS